VPGPLTGLRWHGGFTTDELHGSTQTFTSWNNGSAA
jgi:hypothetical protein